MTERMFPIMPDAPREYTKRWIPWRVIAPHNDQALINHCGQSLEHLAGRGGLGESEAVAVLENRRYTSLGWQEARRRLEEIVAKANSNVTTEGES